ncbi:ATP-dependent helicase [Cellulomonas soli]|uniref:DNA 3'-5' helicase n=1 Tax=Cellulomonas soli TaxID=931535 RepID=A0A512P8M6_9CELL|nr:ATP-dependent DNA helicase [Cellulomonas soli]NYI57770.1 superfamily I DNA/RNA helicase/RecB family exonuclease [Cellulomonas soli]GEP67554.1 DNA helicase [Cellulomonas soli]
MTSPTALRLVRPALADVPRTGPGAPVTLDPTQASVVERVAAGTDPALLVLGAPGTGRTTVVLESVVAAVDAGLAPEDVLVLSAGRRAAADLRDRVSARLRRTSGRALVQTVPAAAFAVLRARASALGEPSPTLVSGAEQDLLLAELLAGHADGDGVPLGWPAEVPPDAWTLRAFRDELRDLLMRAAERGLTPADLADLGIAHDRPAWVSAARLYEEYLDVNELRASTPDVGARFDPAVVVDEAARALLAWDDEVPGMPRPRWRLVAVDDHQESTAATARLLRVLADDGARLLLVGDPDVAVQTFRGATPSLVARAAVPGRGPGELGAETLVLGTVWRHGPVLRDVVTHVTERVGASGAVAHRKASPADGRADGHVRVAILPSAAQEAAYVAHTLREAHLEGSVPWQEMAVVTRSGAHVTALRRALAAASVPVSVLGSDVPLREEPAVRPLLDAVRVVVGAVPLTAEGAARLACSPLGGLDAVGLRRVRRALRAEELDGGGGRSSDVLLVEALETPGRAATLPPGVRRPVEHLAGVLQAGRDAAARTGADAQTVLWALWDTAGLAEAWRRSALAGGAGGSRADRDLDAVLALFRAAETFVDRMPQSPPGAFADWLQAQDLPSDTIAARASRESVQVLTPAGAAGREWDVVVVAGVQEGAWPDLRLRDSLLGAQTLVEILAGRSDGTLDVAGARQAVLADELRSFAVACSRSRSHLLVTAVADTDAQPSPFCDLVDPCDTDVDPRRTVAPSPLDLRGLVALLRARLESAALAGTQDTASAATLARLAAQGVTGAHPDDWYGLAGPSSDAPLWSADEKVPVSPSKLESAQRCALRWAFESAGGTAADSSGQTLGTLVHAIAQDLPTGTEPELLAALDERWSQLGLGEGWPALATRRKAEAMVRRLAGYLRGAGAPLLVEGAFRLETDRAVVKGSVDRVERVDDDHVRIADLKTGANPPSKDQAATNPQLGAYQLAVDAGAFEALPEATSTGAQLVYLGTGASATLRTQDALGPEDEGPSWARTLVDGVADRMAASAFEATVNDLCDRCPVRRACPARAEGGQVVE